MWKDLDMEQMAEEENSYSPPRSPEEVEQIVMIARDELHNRSQPCGMKSLQGRLNDFYHLKPLPSVKTIGRILAGKGLRDGM